LLGKVCVRRHSRHQRLHPTGWFFDARKAINVLTAQTALNQTDTSLNTKNKVQSAIFSLGVGVVNGAIFVAVAWFCIMAFAFIRSALTPGGLGMGMLFYFYIAAMQAFVTGPIGLLIGAYAGWKFWQKNIASKGIATKTALLLSSFIPILTSIAAPLLILDKKQNESRIYATDNIEDCLQLQDKSDIERCFYTKQAIVKDISDCDLIESYSQSGLVRPNSCVAQVAINKLDPSTCLQVRYKYSEKDADLTIATNRCLAYYIEETKQFEACSLIDQRQLDDSAFMQDVVADCNSQPQTSPL